MPIPKWSEVLLAFFAGLTVVALESFLIDDASMAAAIEPVNFAFIGEDVLLADTGLFFIAVFIQTPMVLEVGCTTAAEC